LGLAAGLTRRVAGPVRPGQPLLPHARAARAALLLGRLPQMPRAGPLFNGLHCCLKPRTGAASTARQLGGGRRLMARTLQAAA